MRKKNGAQRIIAATKTSASLVGNRQSVTVTTRNALTTLIKNVQRMSDHGTLGELLAHFGRAKAQAQAIIDENEDDPLEVLAVFDELEQNIYRTGNFNDRKKYEDLLAEIEGDQVGRVHGRPLDEFIDDMKRDRDMVRELIEIVGPDFQVEKL